MGSLRKEHRGYGRNMMGMKGFRLVYPYQIPAVFLGFPVWVAVKECNFNIRFIRISTKYYASLVTAT